MKTLVLVLVLLSGCATIDGVKISDTERADCQRSQDCTVWAPAELHELASRAYTAGVSRARQEKGGI